jgi:predicted SAM-dependent methyltransferase
LSRYFLPAGLRRLWRPLFQELKLLARTWLNILLPHRLYRYLRMRRQRHTRIHVGCGSKVFKGWLNVDMNPKGDLTTDLREGLPFANDSAALIYTEHSLEHFYREHDGPFLLRECLRVLEPGGRIRITVPDAALYMDYYSGRLDPEPAQTIRQSHNRFHGTRMDAVNSAFRWKHQHHYMYDEETLRALLEEIGFTDIQRKGFRDSEVEELRQCDLESRRLETLYMEARKTGAPTGSTSPGHC